MKQLLLISTLILGFSTVPTLTAQAAGSEANTETQLELTADTDPTKPVDPEDPSEELDPEDEDNPGTGNRGQLTLDVAPKAFNFGSVKMDVNERTYKAETNNANRQYIQVTDKRDADKQGWQVVVRQTQELTEQNPASGSAHVLTGTTIHLPKGTPRNSLNSPASATATNLNTAIANITGTTAETTVFSPTTAATAGKGTSTSVWAPTGVELTIPQNTAKVGKYKGTINWTLTAAASS